VDKHTNIYLIGLMGAGKTTVGKQLARRLHRPFYDSDHEIVERTGVPIPTIFEIEGEPGFRRREAQTIGELTALPAIVMATGGGVVLDPENRRCLRETGWVVYLNVPPFHLYQRTRNDRNRPLLQVDNPLARLEELHAARDPLYRETAHLVIDGGRLVASGIVQYILREYAQLNPVQTT
jgi:shikimate kinase